MNNINLKPPKPASRLLLWFIKDGLAEEVLGDLEEKFYSTAAKGSLWRAKLNYWYQVLHYFRPFAIRVLWTCSFLHAWGTSIGIRHA